MISAAAISDPGRRSASRRAERRDRRPGPGTWMAIAVAAVVLSLLAPAVGAQSDSTSMSSTTLVIGRAEIIGVSAINFASYDPTSSTPADAVGGVTVRATKELSYTIYIGADRQMNDGSGNTLDYELYVDSSRTTVWGATAATGIPKTSSGNAPTTYSIYGRIPALQDVPAGQFNDTVTITVEW